ncbi:hypothetical protein [Streptomyces noursei]|uniref:hypothetical protein n=1 Tax=Streptomyces noursei TaxID=1971 RepID=UPI00167B0AF4|nr:hypothetical protein [Streptomyces noursei]MCZ1019592.1 hypothetical protein [Streptomyces noursei]GGX09782.1 hypothetical protein GCM10010341_34350 [Streptomyces noursei]
MREHISDLPLEGAGPCTRSRPLPAYRGILAVDAKGFTGRPAIEHEVISRAVPELLETAFTRAGLQELWDNRKFPATTGDGYVFGFDPSLMPFVIHPLLLTLQDVLTDFNVLSHGAVPIRLRASLHVGPLPDTGDEFSGNGTARNDTHRLLDSRPVKAVLASHKENVTHVAAILSGRCYEDAVAGGYTGLHPDHFVEVIATVDGKPFSQQAWIYVPQPSGPLYEEVPSDSAVEGPAREDTGPLESGGARNWHVTNSAPNGNVNTGTVHGGQSVGNYNVAGDHVEGNKAGRVRGFQGDQVHGAKHQGRQ